MLRIRLALSLSVALAVLAHSDRATAGAGKEVRWHRDYGDACRQAERQRKMLFIHFSDSANSADQRLTAETLADPRVEEKLASLVCLRLPIDSTVPVEGRPIRLVDHEAFAHMYGQPGVAIVDYAHPGTADYGYCVSMFPLNVKHWYSAEHMLTVLDLPRGSLTQRTMIYAVRIHPEQPASTRGRLHPCLLGEAESHSSHQAQICVQGHHNWGYRFQRLLGRIPRGLTPSEVCAESWPGESLVDAAVECVRCWRMSSGHWRAVRSQHPVYAYDMKRGTNGIWYATGVFGEGPAGMDLAEDEPVAETQLTGHQEE